MMHSPLPSDMHVELDACMTGVGGRCGDEVYHCTIPPFIIDENHHITNLEMLNLVIAAKLWKSKWQGHHITIHCNVLAHSFSSPKPIVNYIGGVRFLHKLLNVSSTALASFNLELMMRALNITMERKTPVRLPVTLEMLQALCEICDMLPPNGVVFKCVFLFAFFGFFRCSYLVPSSNAFDVTRNLCGGDVFITNGKLIILVKWSKTR